MHRELPLYFTQVLGEQAWVGSKYTRIRDLTLENAKLLVKLLSPETANIKNVFNQKTLLYTKMVRGRNNVKAKVSKPKMATEAEEILDKVDHIMDQMRTYPVADIKEDFLEQMLLAGCFVTYLLLDVILLT